MILILVTAFSTTIHNQPPQHRLHMMEDQFAAKYPQWDNFSQETKQELYGMFDRSSNKYLWFPNMYPQPEKKVYYYTPPRIRYEEYIRKGGT